MKSGSVIVLILLSLACTFAQGQASDTSKDSLPGFLDIRWGEPAASARGKMAKVEGTAFDERTSSRHGGNALVFSGGTFFGQHVSAFELYFADDQFHTARVVVARSSNDSTAGSAVATYSDLKNAIAAHYGDPAMDNEVNSPSGAVSTLWSFAAQGEIANSIFMTLAQGQRVVVEFHNGKLLNEAWRKGTYR